MEVLYTFCSELKFLVLPAETHRSLSLKTVTMLRMLSMYDPLDVYYDLCDYRQKYDREDVDDSRVTLTAEVRFTSSTEFEEAKVKVIDIGPDPPLCVKRYIWGRKSKMLVLYQLFC